jgi:hypothetical protein
VTRADLTEDCEIPDSAHGGVSEIPTASNKVTTAKAWDLAAIVEQAALNECACVVILPVNHKALSLKFGPQVKRHISNSHPRRKATPAASKRDR